MDRLGVTPLGCKLAALKMIIRNLNGALNRNPSDDASWREALLPLLAFDWNRELMEAVSSAVLNGLLARLRMSSCKVDHKLVCLVRNTIKSGLLDRTCLFPPELEGWRSLLVSFSLDSQRDLRSWRDAIQRINDLHIDTPQTLALCSQGQMEKLPLPLEEKGFTMELWQAARLSYPGERPPARGESSYAIDPHRLVEDIRAKSVATTGPGMALERARERLELPPNFEQLGPAARLKVLRDSTADREDIKSFLHHGSRVNILKKVERSLGPVASGLQGYLNFCELLHVSPFPPRASTLVNWSTLFTAGRTFQAYLSHVKTACLVAGYDTSCFTPEVLAAARGLKNSLHRGSQSINYIWKESLLKIIAREDLSHEFSRLCFISYVFLLRVPSEALPLVRAFPDEDVTAKSRPLDSPALIDLRRVDGTLKLVIKLDSRKNIRGGAVLSRPCLCARESFGKGSICPVHTLWPAIRAGTRCGQPLFPSYNSGNLNPTLKTVLEKCGVKDALQLSPHGFRRAAAEELKRQGGSYGLIMSMGNWNSQAFKGYLTFDLDEEREIVQLMAQDTSEEEDTPPPRSRRKLEKRKRRKKRRREPEGSSQATSSSSSS